MSDDLEREADFRLTPAQRVALRPGIDLDALEELLSVLPSDLRPLVLHTLSAQPDRAALDAWVTSTANPLAPSDSTRSVWLPPDVVFDDTRLQALLERAIRNVKRD
ncbi:MAG: hypothetical protein M3081_21685 [Gemmatimonadota bacterium]|nr:hypothetical protein [Gemmatimonadota bacterium]